VALGPWSCLDFELNFRPHLQVLWEISHDCMEAYLQECPHHVLPILKVI
jgi:hypothetical protein